MFLRRGRGVVLMLVCVCLVGGCRPTTPSPGASAEAAYAEAFRAVMVEYRERARDVNEHPPSQRKGSTAAQRRGASADYVERMAATYRQSARRLEALQPPPLYSDLHLAQLRLLEEGAAWHSRWATAIRSGDREAAKEASTEIDETVRRGLDTIERVNERLGPRAVRIDEAPQEAGAKPN